MAVYCSTIGRLNRSNRSFLFPCIVCYGICGSFIIQCFFYKVVYI